MSDGSAASAFGEGLRAERAAVTPRAHRPESEANLPIDQLLLSLTRTESKGLVLITGAPGDGKTTALEHLRAVLPNDLAIGLFDLHHISEAKRSAQCRLTALAALDAQGFGALLDRFVLAPWTLDDCAEYLLATHREQCASVLARLRQDASLRSLKGSPQLLTLVMDAMAADPTILDSRQVLRNHIRKLHPPGDALDRLMIDGALHGRPTKEQWHWWRHERIRQVCTANWIASQLCEGKIPGILESMEGCSQLIPEIAATVQNNTAPIDCLERFLRAPKPSSAGAVAASILFAADKNWRPANGRALNLSKAQLPGAQWAGVDLTGASMVGTNFVGADLSGAILNDVIADGANFSGTNLHGAQLRNGRFRGSNLFAADLSETSASKAEFSDANLEAVNLCNGDFSHGRFMNSELSEVHGDHADFSSAWFGSVNTAQSDFSSANFILAKMDRVDLSAAKWTGACFAKAEFRDCSFEGLDLPSADFDDANLSGCVLTASHIPKGRFRCANLTRTGLADIEWENADLRGADLENASFHMGSTRSGLVGSTIPCEGSRTGFYTDEYYEQLYKSPEEIRKACLCGANLIGAKVEKTDFYLVDLRRAKYSKAQAHHFTRSGAILRSAKA